LEYAQKLLKLSPNCKISFSGIVTFKNAKEIQETAKNIPLKNILVETDSPYLTPTPFRGKEENEPAFTKYVLEKIIELRTEDSEKIKKTIFKNSLEMFGRK
jgi:TatD DNase family protein